MNLNMPEITVKARYRMPLPAVHSRVHSLLCNYNGTYACEWRDEYITVPLEGQTLDGVPDALRKVKKPDGVDIMVLEVTLHFKEDSDDRHSVTFEHTVDMNLHTYVSPDGKVRVPYRAESDRFGKSNDVERLKEAAAKQGVKVNIVNAIGAVL